MIHTPGDELTVTTWSGCQTRVSGAWLARHARRPLDPTPPGPPIEGEQPDLLEMLEATP